MLGQLPPDHPNLISVQNNIAATLIEMKDWRAAAPLLESIVARLEKRFPSGNDQLLRAKANLAAAYLNTNRVDGAEELSRYVLLMRQRDSPVNRPNIFKSMHQLASVLEAKRDYPAALRQYKEVYELRKKYLGTHHVETITTARAIGGLYADTGDTQSACAIYAEVIASIEKLRDYGPTSEQFKQAYFRDFAQAYKYYARLLGRLGRWDEAFRVAEGSKARTLTESTRLRLSSLSKTITVQEAADLDQLERRVVTMNTRIAMHNAVNAPASKLLEYETERDASLQLLSGKRTALAATYGWTEPSVAASTFTPKDAALNLEAGDVFVSFAMLGDSLVGMALDRQGAVTGKLVTQPGLARSIKVLRLLLSQPNGMDFYRMGDDLTPPHRLWKLQTGGFALEPLEDGPIAGAAIAKSTGDVLEFVSNAVLSAVPANTWSAKRLVISPDEELALLPFDALTREGKPLIVKREIVFAQSWTMHTLLRQREIAYSTLNRAPMLVFGNATYGDTSVRGKTRGFEGGGGRTQSSDASTPRPFVDLKWFSLPGSAVEIEAIKTLYALKSRVNFFSGDDASEDSLRQLDRNGQLANYRIVLFSGHGYLHPSQPMLSSIVLAQKASPVTGIEAAEKGESDGYVTAAEVMGMHLHSDLVVLSACQSGLGEIVSGEGVTGLPFGLFSAGNRSTLLTLWSIYDGSSGKFVESFVRKVKKGTRFSSALAQTKREFIEGKAGRSSVGAAHWAPFVMYGT